MANKPTLIGNITNRLKNTGYDAVDALQRGKLRPNEIPLRSQPDFVKKNKLNEFGSSAARSAGKIIKSAASIALPGAGKVVKTVVDRFKKKQK